MADKYLNNTGLQYFYNRIKTIFATQTAFDTLSDRVDEIVAEGGEPNVIETVKVNGTALTPDAQKAVDVIVPTKTSDLTNDGDGTSNFATEAYVQQNGGKIDKIIVNGNEQTITNKTVSIMVGSVAIDDSNEDINLSDGGSGANVLIEPTQNGLSFTYNKADASEIVRELATKEYVDENGGKIDKIKVNGVEQTITNKEVDLTIPTKVSDLTNDSNFQSDTQVSSSITTALANSGNAYQTASDVSSAISSAVASAYKYKGSVATYNDLPASGNTTGDVWDVQETGVNYAWTGTAWDPLGSYVDTSLLWAKSELVAITTAEIDTIVAS